MQRPRWSATAPLRLSHGAGLPTIARKCARLNTPMYKPFRRHWNADNVEHNLSVDGIARGARMHRVNRLLLLLSTAATLDGLVASREALAGCSPSPTPGNDTIVCDVTIPPPTIPSLDLSS